VRRACNNNTSNGMKGVPTIFLKFLKIFVLKLPLKSPKTISPIWPVKHWSSRFLKMRNYITRQVTIVFSADCWTRKQNNSDVTLAKHTWIQRVVGLACEKLLRRITLSKWRGNESAVADGRTATGNPSSMGTSAEAHSQPGQPYSAGTCPSPRLGHWSGVAAVSCH